jgi:hypothetical protein
LQSYRPLLRRQVLTAKCHGGRSLPLLQTAVGSQPPLEMAVPCYFCQCWIQLFIFVKSNIYIYKRYSIPRVLNIIPYPTPRGHPDIPHPRVVWSVFLGRVVFLGRLLFWVRACLTGPARVADRFFSTPVRADLPMFLKFGPN